jgi:cytoskeletal protein RodZ
MNDFGGRLREAREAKGISLREIAGRTKISVAALEALERNDVSKLPGGIFSRSIVKAYAIEVGLDADRTVQEFLDRFDDEPPPAPPATYVPPEEIEFERRKQLAARVFLLAVALMLILAAVVVYVMLRNRPDTSTPYEAGQTGAVTPVGLVAPALLAGQSRS